MKDYATAAIAQRNKEEEELKYYVVRFEEVGSEDGGAGDPLDDDSVSSDASFSEHLDSLASRVFRTPSLQSNQQKAVKRIVLDPSSEGKLLLCEQTGGGRV